MPVYEYRALDKSGKKRKGIIDADNLSQAKSRLRASGTYPFEIKESSGGKVSDVRYGKSGGSIFERIKSEEINVVTRQLATLLAAGIPLLQALSSLVEQTGNPALKRIIAHIRESINEGATLTQALSVHGRYFSSVYINMVRAGEASGSLAVVLERLADFGEKQQVMKGRLRAALVYPLFMAVIGAAVLFLLMTYVVPNITQVFEEMDRVLPLPTVILIGISEVLGKYWWGFIVGTVFVLLLVRFFVNSPGGKSFWDYLKLRMPITGVVTQKIILVRFASTLGSLLKSGVDVMAAMHIIKALINNTQISKVIEAAMKDIENGQSITTSLRLSPWFPPMFTQMVTAGEQSGEMENMLERVAQTYERELEVSIAGMASLIEPAMITAMGGVVMFIVLSILLPIFEMNQMVG